MKYQSSVAKSICVLVFLTGIQGCTRLAGDTEAVLALEDIAAGDKQSRLKEKTAQPSRRMIQYEVKGRSYEGDLYLSADRTDAGILLIPGVVPEGKNDPRLVALAYSLARLRFAVMVPDMPSLRRFKVGTHNIDEVTDAFSYLTSRHDLSPGGRAGIAGFSYGMGPVLLASLRPQIRDRVQFILSVGGYYNLNNVIAYFTTGTYPDDITEGKDTDLQPPAPYIKWIFTLSNAELVKSPDDRDFLRKYAKQIIEGVTPLPLPPVLGDDARAVYNLLTNRNPEKVPELIAKLPAHIRMELKGLNPAAQDISKLQAKVILLHGRMDNLIPYHESLALASDLPSRQVKRFIIDGLVHVDLEAKPHDIPVLLDAMEVLLDQRE